METKTHYNTKYKKYQILGLWWWIADFTNNKEDWSPRKKILSSCGIGKFVISAYFGNVWQDWKRIDLRI